MFIRQMWSIYSGKHVSRSAAQLSYFLTLSVFPTIMCLYSVLEDRIPTEEIIYWLFEDMIPTNALDAVSDYFAYVRAHSGRQMLIGGGTIMVTSSGAAFRALHTIIAEIQGERKYRGIGYFLESMLFSLLFLVVMYFAMVVIVTGEWFLRMLSRLMPVPWSWEWLRFVLLFALLLMLVLGLYRLTSPRGGRDGLLPGAVLSSAAMVGASMVFSAMVSYSVRYDMVYGSLASMVILMLYLYLFGNILIMGCAVNHILSRKGNI